jgi:UDP-N-acetylglucosamine diphosphorylase/glucosamine-1-phosphate N-acetyltransferase
VWIGRRVTILPHCYVQGPAYIGDCSFLQVGTVIHAGTSIGPVCKVGGEIEASIIQGYSNKQHDGFLGHSYVGSWVNIAADCVSSDLKNTYGTVRVPINGRDVDTCELFVGMIFGDHSKTGINVSFPTGSVIGFCSNVLALRSPKFVPSFTWIDDGSMEHFDVQRGLAIARKVMARRNRTMTAAEERAFLAVCPQAMNVEHFPQSKSLQRSQLHVVPQRLAAQ